MFKDFNLEASMDSSELRSQKLFRVPLEFFSEKVQYIDIIVLINIICIHTYNFFAENLNIEY